MVRNQYKFIDIIKAIGPQSNQMYSLEMGAAELKIEFEAHVVIFIDWPQTWFAILLDNTVSFATPLCVHAARRKSRLKIRLNELEKVHTHTLVHLSLLKCSSSRVSWTSHLPHLLFNFITIQDYRCDSLYIPDLFNVCMCMCGWKCELKYNFHCCQSPNTYNDVPNYASTPSVYTIRRINSLLTWRVPRYLVCSLRVNCTIKRQTIDTHPLFFQFISFFMPATATMIAAHAAATKLYLFHLMNLIAFIFANMTLLR